MFSMRMSVHLLSRSLHSPPPFAGDHLITPFRKLTTDYDRSGEVNFAKACLRYVINLGLDIDSTLGGMYYPYHVYENVDAFFNPKMTDEERAVLKKIRRNVKHITKYWLPEHYQFLEAWKSDSQDDSDLYRRA